MLGKMPREARDLRGERHETPHRGRLRIEAEFPHPLGFARPLRPPVDAAGEPIEGLRREAEGLADIPHRAAAAIADDLRGERRAIATVPRIEVLDHLLAPAMLEVDVDVGRLVPLLADESLEERLDAIGIDRGHPEAEADHRIGGRAAALAEDAPRPCEAHEIVDGEEVTRVVEFGDQREFVLDALAHAGRHALAMARRRVSLDRPRLDELAQMRIGRAIGRHDLARVLVAQFPEAEGDASRRDLARPIDRRLDERSEPAADLRSQRREASPHRGIRLQRPIAAAKQIEPHPIERAPDANRGQHILQRPPRDRVPVHVVGRDERHAEMRREHRKLPVAEILARIADPANRDREPRIVCAMPRASSCLIVPRESLRDLDERLIDDAGRHQRDPEACVMFEQIVQEETRPPLAGTTAPERDQPAEPSVRLARVDVHEHLDEVFGARPMRMKARVFFTRARERPAIVELAPRVRSRPERLAGFMDSMGLVGLVELMTPMGPTVPTVLVEFMTPMGLMRPIRPI